MNKALLKTVMHWPKPYITGTDFRVVFKGTEDARKSVIKRAVNEHYLLRLKQNLYIIQGLPRKDLPDAFELAQFIWGPSYISFESALSHHRLIPEAVYTTTSASAKKSNTVDTPIGIFSFEKIPVEIFADGVYSFCDGNARYLLAHPWKALADMIYCRNKNWKNINDLSEDLRIEEELLKNLDRDLLIFLSENYPSNRTKNVLKKLRW